MRISIIIVRQECCSQQERMNAVRDKIKTALEEYCHVIEAVKQRQNDWNTSTKAEIVRVLSSISDDLKPLKVVEDGSPRNFDTVCLGFPPSRTNIVLRQGAGAKGLTRFGGYLSYSQVFNGKILVGISYPYVEDLQDATPNKGLALLDPSEITEEMILEHVDTFLREITEAEKTISMSDQLQRKRRIGFAASDSD